MNNEQYLPGCGVLVVSWINAAQAQAQADCEIKTSIPRPENKSLRQDIRRQIEIARRSPANKTANLSRGWLMILDNLEVFGIKSYEQLEALQKRDFSDWTTYGKQTHLQLKTLAESKGYKIAEW